jgi:SMODS-associating 2TM, beta-strand rich effector domain
MSRLALSMIVSLCAGIWALVLSAHGWVLPLSFFSPLSIVVSALTIGLPLWDRWLWHLRVLHPWVVSRPDLRGTWQGKLTRANGEPIAIFLVVEQSFSTIALRTFTTESHSASLSASLAKDKGQFQLAYIYRNEPKQLFRDRSPIHRGAVWLSVQGDDSAELDGDYWTDRDTKGEVHFKRVSRRLVSDSASAKALAERPPEAQASPSNRRSFPRVMPSSSAALD